jgi:hypothetical protein
MDINDLVEKVPAIRRWIDDILVRSRPLAKRIDSLAFPRLSSFYSLETLRNAYVLDVDQVPIPPLTALGLHEFADFERMEMDGITYQDTYFLRHHRSRDEALHFHELVHIVQWRLLGPERFVLAYALGHALYGYSSNPFESMAYQLQAKFESNDPPFSVEAAVNRDLQPLLPALFGSAR